MIVIVWRTKMETVGSLLLNCERLFGLLKKKEHIIPKGEKRRAETIYHPQSSCCIVCALCATLPHCFKSTVVMCYKVLLSNHLLQYCTFILNGAALKTVHLYMFYNYSLQGQSQLLLKWETGYILDRSAVHHRSRLAKDWTGLSTSGDITPK